jgi:tRNA nucleotidyltransferase/poly(A) polymerase
MDAAALLPPPLRRLPPLAQAAGSAWLVGGAPRDSLLRRQTRDLDLVVRHDACRLARCIANALGADYYTLDPDRDVGRVLFEDAGERWTLDVARLRGADIDDDLRLRDFTVNAIAVGLADGAWRDPLGGAADLRDHRLRLCSPEAIRDDPIRILRAVRFSLDLNLRIDPDAVRALRAAAGSLSSASAERLRDEAFRLLALEAPASALRLLDELTGLQALFPEVDALHGVEQPSPHAYDAWNHTLAVVDGMRAVLRCLAPGGESDGAGDLVLAEARLHLGAFAPALQAHLHKAPAAARPLSSLLIFDALYHDVGKAVTRSVDASGAIRFLGHEAVSAELAVERARALRLSGEEVERIGAAIAQHMRPGQLEKSQPISRRSLYRYFRDCGPAGIDVLLLSLADLLGKATPPVAPERWRMRLAAVRQMLESYFENHDDHLDPAPLVDGDDLMARLQLSPGPEIGRLLEALREAQAAGEVSTRDQALDLAASLHTGPLRGPRLRDD